MCFPVSVGARAVQIRRAFEEVPVILHEGEKVMFGAAKETLPKDLLKVATKVDDPAKAAIEAVQDAKKKPWISQNAFPNSWPMGMGGTITVPSFTATQIQPSSSPRGQLVGNSGG